MQAAAKADAGSCEGRRSILHFPTQAGASGQPACNTERRQAEHHVSKPVSRAFKAHFIQYYINNNVLSLIFPHNYLQVSQNWHTFARRKM